MARYCDKCRLGPWPRTPPSYQGNFKCEVCGAITWCHTGPDNLEKHIEQERAEYQKSHPEGAPAPLIEEKSKPLVRTRPRTARRREE